MKNREYLEKGLKSYGIDVNTEMLDRFDSYINILLDWNKKINLTAITDENEIIAKHFLDSVSCIKSRKISKDSKVIDIGTGAGFPGVPLKIVMPEIELCLLDSLNKRVLFLSELMNKLGLKAEIVHGRAEDYGNKKGFRESFDISLSRAVAPMNVLVEYTLPFVKVGGYALCQKGPTIFDELGKAQRAIEILGGKEEEILSTQVYNKELDHYIVKIRKVGLCPGKYPRKAGIVEKNPLR